MANNFFVITGVKNNYTALATPGITDDASKGYEPGSTWIDNSVSPSEVYKCTDATVGAAIWQNTTFTAAEAGSVAVGGDCSGIVSNITVATVGGASAANLAAHIIATSNPHSVTASQAGAVALSLASVLGDTIYASAANTFSTLSGNTTTTKMFLSQTGDSVNSAAPVWSAVSKSDVGLGDVANKLAIAADGTQALTADWNAGAFDITAAEFIAPSFHNLAAITLKTDNKALGVTGAVTIRTGDSGDNTVGSITIQPGDIGAVISGDGYDGGEILFTAGKGGDTSDLLRKGGTGGIVRITGGIGGKADDVTNPGGNVVITGGKGGVSDNGVGAIGGSVIISPGAGGGGGGADGAPGFVTLSAPQDKTLLTNSPSGSVTGAIADVSYVQGYGIAKSIAVALGDVIYASAASTFAKLAGNTTAIRKFLHQTGDGGGNSAAPAWGVLTRVIALTASASITPDADSTISRCVFTLTTGGEDFALNAISNKIAGCEYVIIITQGATARVITWNAEYLFTGGQDSILTPTAGAVDVFKFVYDGSKLVNTSVGYALA